MTRAKNETPEQREKRLARARKSESKRRAKETPEQREKRLARFKRTYHERMAKETPEKYEARLARARASSRRQRLNETPEQRRKRLLRTALRSENIHKPDAKMDRSVTVMVFCQCLADGLNPSIHYNITASAFKIANEFEWLGRSYLHPDTLDNYGARLAYRWRNEPKLRRKYHQG